MFGGLRTFLIGYHNPIIHTYFVTKAWKKIYGKYPDSREFICILFHDIGYITQRNSYVSNDKDIHPLLGAQICDILFGYKYYMLCIGHSRDYAKKRGVLLSKLCYADKYSVLLLSPQIRKLIYLLDSPEVTQQIILEFRKSCDKWWKEEGWIIK